ncbi:uncharacterized protein LY79DRAFT_557042 [Colletotrichum navitas]|uniref:Uncharacterized protein n=1 Tax=Colletotrichum navitas TaxID=681940 RepID=A0AAD8PX64_9PEZI|nr:uncharacterized protein LY79DRAFT_557042 [Colletotrichum navitas]KAK1586167.1 hypothetical protein LY79DRAFT_557042 [Colletotrichum navitas]
MRSNGRASSGYSELETMMSVDTPRDDIILDQARGHSPSSPHSQLLLPGPPPHGSTSPIILNPCRPVSPLPNLCFPHISRRTQVEPLMVPAQTTDAIRYQPAADVTLPLYFNRPIPTPVRDRILVSHLVRIHEHAERGTSTEAESCGRRKSCRVLRGGGRGVKSRLEEPWLRS